MVSAMTWFLADCKSERSNWMSVSVIGEAETSTVCAKMNGVSNRHTAQVMLKFLI
jgi:hypothetical protein